MPEEEEDYEKVENIEEKIVVQSGKHKLPSFKQALAFKFDKPPKFLLKPAK